MIVSVIPGEILNGLRQRLPKSALRIIHPMTVDVAEDLLDTWLKNAERTLQPDQREEVLTKFEHNGLPLYLKLAFEEARLWRSYDEQITLAPEVHSLLRDNLFARLSSPQEHGTELVQHSMAYLAAAKKGLAEEEILDLLALGEYWDYFDENRYQDHELPPAEEGKENHLPFIIWSRLALDLDAYMVTRQQDDRELYNFYHRQFAEAVDTLYLAPNRQEKHAQLADYYQAQPLSNLRKLTELTYQLYHADQLDTLRDLLLTLDYLQNKLNATDPNALIADYDYLPDDRSIQLVRQSLSLAANILNQRAEQLPIQLVARLMSYNDNTYPDIAELLAFCQKPPGNLFPTKQTFPPAGGGIVAHA